MQFFFRLLPASWGNEFGYEWAKKSRLKEKDGTYPYKGEDKEELVLYAKELEQAGNHHDLYVFGHRHIELDLMLSRDSRLMILGDCWRMFTYAQLDEQGVVIMNNFEQ